MDGLARTTWCAVATLAACGPVHAASPAGAQPSAPDAAPYAHAIHAPSPADTTRLTVSGSAEVRIPADRVRLAFAVETEAVAAADAASQNAEVMTAVLDRVRAVVGPDDRVETSGYRLMPRYRPPSERDGEPEIVGYRAQNGVVVVLTDVDAVGTVLDAALEGGANRVADLSFFASDVEDARLQAIREATEKARREAETVAAALGLMLGPPLDIQTGGGGGGRPPIMLRAEASMAMDTPVETGSESVTATVTITWRLDGGSVR